MSELSKVVTIADLEVETAARQAADSALSARIDAIGSNVSFDLLWTNSAPSSNFTAKTVSAALEDYDFAIIVCRGSTSGNNNIPVWVEVGKSSYCNAFVNINAASIMSLAYRSFTASTTGIAFNDAYLKSFNSSANPSANNSYIIPLRIYGVKRYQINR